MSDLLLDTHALVWYLAGSSKLTDPARAAIKSSLAAGEILHISAVSLAEILYLEEKGRLIVGTLTTVYSELSRPTSGIVVAPVVLQTVQAMAHIARQVVPDFPDRLIAGTALQLGLPLLTADHRIRAAGLTVIW